MNVHSSFPNDMLWQWPQVPCLVNYAQWEEKAFPFGLNLNISLDAFSCCAMRCGEQYIHLLFLFLISYTFVVTLGISS